MPQVIDIHTDARHARACRFVFRPALTQQSLFTAPTNPPTHQPSHESIQPTECGDTVTADLSILVQVINVAPQQPPAKTVCDATKPTTFEKVAVVVSLQGSTDTSAKIDTVSDPTAVCVPDGTQGLNEKGEGTYFFKCTVTGSGQGQFVATATSSCKWFCKCCQLAICNQPGQRLLKP